MVTSESPKGWSWIIQTEKVEVVSDNEKGVQFSWQLLAPVSLNKELAGVGVMYQSLAGKQNRVKRQRLWQSGLTTQALPCQSEMLTARYSLSNRTHTG